MAQQSKTPMEGGTGSSRKLYRHKCASYVIHPGVPISMTDENKSALIKALDSRLSSHYPLNHLQACVICEDPCTHGQFAVERALFIPLKTADGPSSSPSGTDNRSRFRAHIARVCCNECALEYAKEKGIDFDPSSAGYQKIRVKPVLSAWREHMASEKKKSNSSHHSNSGKSGMPSTQSSSSSSSSSTSSSDRPSSGKRTANDGGIGQGGGGGGSGERMMKPSSTGATAGGGGTRDRDPFEDGFLICTQLVKTGGADQGGLQVGDVFVKFGSYDKSRFPGLKAIANLVRKSAGRDINVVVWRKLETTTMQMMDDSSIIHDTGGPNGNPNARTIYQKLALSLRPLQSHDADGGGVLGAVINSYPLPSAVQ